MSTENDSMVKLFPKDEDTKKAPIVKNGNFTMENVRSMVKQVAELDEQIKELRDEKKKVMADFVEEYNIPKKEVAEAMKMLKGDIDPEVTTSIYSHIADLVDVK